ncbi:Regulator of chromosome condensation (RCC1) repeat family protein [Theileria parva strain Muguga]|uniref:Regulator of chromosome condensation (RCC1) repeat family protein n=1 Tax=Theileria parva strain Muguga TaxID=333668 RepID=UPI001C622914|nr:Regulator of chromosome condensation (RCC1) repeat family protein [Theileria parva strain Muguga]EAN34429.2 Regulator of chromosome condensation (RCC1) repeat family protein [Theileria parva strain Muguga]
MKFVRYFIKNLRVSFFYPIFQIPNAVSFCDSNSVSFCDSNTAKPRDSKPQTHKSHNVYMFGSVKSLPEGLSKHPLLQRLECKLVDFGPNFGVAVDKKSNVYLWGSDTQNEFVKPFLLCTLSNIKDLQCANNEIYILLSNGTVLLIKDVNDILNTPHVNCVLQEIPEFSGGFLYNNPKIVRMSIGQYHSAFISDDGSLYCSGNNEFGQCAQKPTQLHTESTFLVYNNNTNTIDQIPPTKVRFRENVRIKDVVCGQTHTLCIDTNNNIYSFGDDSEIELFFGDSRGKSIFEHRHYKPYLKRIYNFSPINTSPIIYNQTEKHLQYVPVRINEMSLLKRYGELIRKSDIKLQAGNHFTIIAITPTHSLHTVNNVNTNNSVNNVNNVNIVNRVNGVNNSIILSSGLNVSGQCGSLDPVSTAAKRVRISKPVRDLTCGTAHCFLLTNNSIYLWGDNKQKQLSLDKKTVWTPERLKLNPEEEIKYIKCSYNNSAIITQHNQ